MSEAFPLYILILDYILGMIMWTLLARAVLDLFIHPDSKMVIAKVFRQLTNPLIRLFGIVTPSFLVPILVPVYVAWWFFMIRFYVVPLIFIGEMGMLSFSLEGFMGDIIESIYK